MKPTNVILCLLHVRFPRINRLLVRRRAFIRLSREEHLVGLIQSSDNHTICNGAGELLLEVADGRVEGLSHAREIDLGVRGDVLPQRALADHVLKHRNVRTQEQVIQHGVLDGRKRAQARCVLGLIEVGDHGAELRNGLEEHLHLRRVNEVFADLGAVERGQRAQRRRRHNICGGQDRQPRVERLRADFLEQLLRNRLEPFLLQQHERLHELELADLGLVCAGVNALFCLIKALRDVRVVVVLQRDLCHRQTHLHHLLRRRAVIKHTRVVTDGAGEVAGGMHERRERDQGDADVIFDKDVGFRSVQLCFQGLHALVVGLLRLFHPRVVDGQVLYAGLCELRDKVLVGDDVVALLEKGERDAAGSGAHVLTGGREGDCGHTV
eukprot:PhM_4_TR7808/c0_g1_i1/m.69722